MHLPESNCSRSYPLNIFWTAPCRAICNFYIVTTSSISTYPLRASLFCWVPMLSACCLSVCSQTFYNGSTMLRRCTMNFNKCMIMHYKKHFKSHDSHHQWFSMVTLWGTNISLSKTMIFLLQRWNVLLSWRDYRFSPCHLSELRQGALTQLAAESFAFFDQGIFCSPMLKKSLWSNYLSVGNMINA